MKSLICNKIIINIVNGMSGQDFIPCFNDFPSSSVRFPKYSELDFLLPSYIYVLDLFIN